ncbi:MAG: hypothetical protein IJS01_13775 [Lentisphaeria bacterium]|nr:hypothetical protein [Lentisphaeria bacterium]
MSNKGILFGILLAGALLRSAAVMGLAQERQGRRFVLTTRTVSVTVEDARITEIRSPSGAPFTDSVKEACNTAGLCRLQKGMEHELSRIHFLWPFPKRHTPDKPTTLYHRSVKETKISYIPGKDSAKIVWKGLSDGENFFPEEEIELEFRESPDGALAFRSGARASDGVTGVCVPIENLPQEGSFYLPSCAGVRFPGKDEEKLCMYQSADFFAAPFAAYVKEDSALGVWSEDETCRPFHFFMYYKKRSDALAFEFRNFIPFDQWKEFSSPWTKLNLFPGCDWVGAARPFRDWYRKCFAKEIALRDGLWKDVRTQALVDAGDMTEKGLQEIAKHMDPRRVQIHEWSARKPTFDTELPDFTPKPAYIEKVKRIHKHGFRASAYLNPLCANYMSPVWKRDDLGKLFLPRQTIIASYASINKTQPMIPGRLYYGEPLKKGWRDYITKVFREFLKETGTDVIYIDTFGLIDDAAHGEVEGLRAAQATREFGRQLLFSLRVPMWPEYASIPTSFSTQMFVLSPVVGGDKFNTHRIHNSHPIVAFLYRQRSCAGTGRATSNSLRHRLLALLDGTAGIAPFASEVPLRMESGFVEQFVLRAKIMADNDLEPYYPEKRYPENIRCMYKDKKGRIFRYYDDGRLQMMIDPDGRALYGRIDGVSEFLRPELGLHLPGWPCQDDKGIYNLDPGKQYALFPQKPDAEPDILSSRLPDGYAVGTCYSLKDAAYFEIISTKKYLKNAEIELKVNSRFREAAVNDVYQRIENGRVAVKGAFPLRIVLLTGKTGKPELSGVSSELLMKEKAFAFPRPARRPEWRGGKFEKTLFYSSPNYNFATLDCVVPVKEKDSALELYTYHRKVPAGNATLVTLLVNGKPVLQRDFGPRNPDYVRHVTSLRELHKRDLNMYRWRVPLGGFAGKTVLVSFRIDNKNELNCDSQCFSMPEVVRDPVEKATEEVVAVQAGNTSQASRRSVKK